MVGEPAVPGGLEIRQTRLYYDPRSGQVRHIHQLASAPGEDLDDARIAAEMTAFEDGLRQQYDDVEFLVVDESELPTRGEIVTVDVEHRTLVLGPGDAAS